MLLYPNPNQGLFNVQIRGLHNEDCSVIVRNHLGRQIQRIELHVSDNMTEVIDLSNSPAGMYFVEISSGALQKVSKVIILK